MDANGEKSGRPRSLEAELQKRNVRNGRFSVAVAA
jgi:hypothetical protein